MKPQDRVSSTRQRVLYATIGGHGARGVRLWFVCNSRLHEEAADTILLSPKSPYMVDAVLNDQLQKLLKEALELCVKIEIVNYREPQENEDRGRVIFDLDEGATPVDILNLVLETTGRDHFRFSGQEDPDAADKLVQDKVRDSFGWLLFPPPRPGRRGRRPSPR